jgi:hypothetical protein
MPYLMMGSVPKDTTGTELLEFITGAGFQVKSDIRMVTSEEGLGIWVADLAEDDYVQAIIVLDGLTFKGTHLDLYSQVVTDESGNPRNLGEASLRMARSTNLKM